MEENIKALIKELKEGQKESYKFMKKFIKENNESDLMYEEGSYHTADLVINRLAAIIHKRKGVK